MGRRSRPKGSARKRGGRGGSEREWVGGLLSPPFFVTDRDEPYRPGLVVWMDVRDGLVVGSDVVEAESIEGAVARSLLVAMAHPLAGPPRRPDRVRVADPALVDAVRAAVGDETPIDVAPTPELDALLEEMLDSMPQPGEDEAETYLADGRVSPEAVATLFESAQLLYHAEPWSFASDAQVLRMDIPAFGVEGACVSIMGEMGDCRGVVIFPSLAGFEAFCQAPEEQRPGHAPIDLGSDWLALAFERGADLPAHIRREVASHGWPVADANAYPRVERRERDGAPRPLVERDVEIAAASAAALAAFSSQHRRLFEMETIEPVCETYSNVSDIEVHFTVPYEAFGMFDVAGRLDGAPSALPKVGRNDPCPCGSGRKYKKCHLAADEAERAPERQRARDHELDHELSDRLGDYAMERFGDEWGDFLLDFLDPEEANMIALQWSLYHYLVEGRTVLAWYLEEHGRRLSRAERAWLDAQHAAWLSVWEVIDVEPGRTLTLRDLLSYEERLVHETRASLVLVKRDVLLGRVVDHDGASVLAGVHPAPLPPREAAEVVRRARGRLRRKRAVPVDRLRDEAFGRYLIARWEEEVDDLRAEPEVLPELRNTDGDALLMTTDYFALERGARAEVETRLAGLEGVEIEEPEGETKGEAEASVYVFVRPDDGAHAAPESGTLIGRVCVTDATLTLETNSRERADALRERIEASCEGLVRHRARDHADPLSEPARAEAPSEPPPPPSPEAEQLVLDFKRRHYADWADHPLPALGGLSPREAVRTAEGRQAVDVLLKDMENREQRGGGGAPFDFGELRRALRLE